MVDINMVRGFRVLIKINSEENTTSGGIIIPDTAKEKPVKGTIVKVGSGKYNDNGDIITIKDLKEGDVVYFTKWSGTEISIKGEKYLVVNESDIIAVE